MLGVRCCAGLELIRGPFYCAVSIHHRLATKDKLQLSDLYGENLLLMHRGWSRYVDQLRDDLWQNHPQINIVDFDFYGMDIFNHCENTNDVLLAIPGWANVHPLLKVIPVEWNHCIPYGILHSPVPTPTVQQFLDAAKRSARNCTTKQIVITVGYKLMNETRLLMRSRFFNNVIRKDGDGFESKFFCWVLICIAVFLAGCIAYMNSIESDTDFKGEETTVQTNQNDTEQYTQDTEISDVINDTAFGDYGRLIFPVNSSYYSGDTLGELGLTWYNNIDPDKTVEIANYMKSHAENGGVIFSIFIPMKKKRPITQKKIQAYFSSKEIPANGLRYATQAVDLPM